MGSEQADRDADDDEKPVHDVDIPYDFSIARYPVTVQQFQEYLADAHREAGDPDCVRGTANAPVVSVSWNEAMEFCEWLTTRWREDGRIPLDSLVILPSEAEWERAARGMDTRSFPWGSKADPECANYGETEINEPSAVGCFPRGASPCGCEEMSGNVLEWTRSRWEGYPYPPPGSARSPREARTASGPRVLRGGAFNYYSGLVRCAVRVRGDPSGRFWDLGFRVVVLSFFSGL
jgi:formylglycine-generating enzyme required for sulfatase activity